MLLIPNALCWSSRKCNCACALPAEVQLRLCVTRRSWQKLFAGKNFVKKMVTAQTQLRSHNEQQRAFGNSNICKIIVFLWMYLSKFHTDSEYSKKKIEISIFWKIILVIICICQPWGDRYANLAHAHCIGTEFAMSLCSSFSALHQCITRVSQRNGKPVNNLLTTHASLGNLYYLEATRFYVCSSRNRERVPRMGKFKFKFWWKNVNLVVTYLEIESWDL